MSWTLVQTASYTTPNTATATPSATFGSNVTSGNLVVGVLAFFDTHTLTSITDNLSNTYTQFQTIDDAADGVKTVGFFAINITNAPNKVTATVNASDFVMLNIAEFHNSVGPSAGTDPNSTGAGTNSASGTAASSGNITTAVNGDLVVGYCMDGQSATAPTVGSGYTTAGTSSGSSAVFGQLLEFQVQTTAGAIAATATVGSGNSRNTAVIAFKPGTGGGATVSQDIIEISQARQRSSYW